MSRWDPKKDKEPLNDHTCGCIYYKKLWNKLKKTENDVDNFSFGGSEWSEKDTNKKGDSHDYTVNNMVNIFIDKEENYSIESELREVKQRDY